jgi:hypothetical protein
MKFYPTTTKPKYDDVLFRQRRTEYIHTIRHLVSPSSSKGKDELVGFGNPEEHIPVLTDSIAFGFEHARPNQPSRKNLCSTTEKMTI